MNESTTGNGEFLTGNLKKVYLKYLAAAFGSALISSVYGVVDMAMVGQYQGPDGTAALAVIAPVWNVVYSLGLLMGIGGSVIFSMLRGQSDQNTERSNQYFTASVLGAVALSAVIWGVLFWFPRPILAFFGAEEGLMPLALAYLRPIQFTIPLFLFNQMLAAFLRNDGNPELAARAVLAGGIFNIFGDYFFVFAMDLGMFGAGLATALGAVISFAAMLTHFFGKKNTLQLVRPREPFRKIKEICVTGFATFFIDVAMGILTIFFNRQILKYLNTDALAVYGIIINISTFVQCCAYSIGQAAQPIISLNFGAGKGERIRKTLNYALVTAAFFALFWTGLSLGAPLLYVRIFMAPTEQVLSIAPSIIRAYSLSFLLLPFNIFSTYYFQAIMQPRISFVVSVVRGVVISGILIHLLPVLFAPDAIWLSMPVTEVLVAVYAGWKMLQHKDPVKAGRQYTQSDGL